jgi:hypothetical protein
VSYAGAAMQVRIPLGGLEGYTLSTVPHAEDEEHVALSASEVRWLLSDWRHEPARSTVRSALSELGVLSWTDEEADDHAFAKVAEEVELGRLFVLRGALRRQDHRFVLESATLEATQGEAPTEENHYIEINVVDDEGNPMPGIAYELTLPDRRKRTGTTGANGQIYVDGIDAGSCKLRLPALDRETWEQG